MIKKLFIVLLSLFCLFLLLSCTAGEPAPDDTAESSILTYVFRGISLPIPDGYRMEESFTPFYSPETGELSVLCCHDWGADFFGYLLMTYDSDGSVIRQTELPLPEDNEPTAGAVTENSLFFLYSDYDRETKTYTYIPAVCSFGDMSITYGDNIAPLFSHPDGEHSRVVCVAADSDGNICVGTYYEILLLDRNLKKKTSLFASAGDTVSDLSTAPDGTMYAVFDCGTHFKALSVDPATGAFEQKISYPTDFVSTGICFGSGYEVFLTGMHGFYGYNTGDSDVTLLLDYQNTGLYQGIAEFLYALSPDCVFLLEQDPGTGISCPTIYRRSADIDLSQLRTVEIAYLGSKFDYNQQVLKYHKNHPDVHIVTIDYRVYETDENPDGGWRRLITDMKTGVFQPDAIVTGSVDLDIDFLSAVYQNKLYTDLYPFLEKSEKVSRDDLLGCVKRTFESDTGELWAIGYDLALTTLVGKTEILGDADSWTLSQMLDFAETLPNESKLLKNLTQEEALWFMLGNSGYAQFIDMESHICDFQSGEFVRYLNFLKTLPMEQDLSESDSSEDCIMNYADGSTVLLHTYISSPYQFISHEEYFLTKDLTIIGFPTRTSGNGSILNMYPFIITSFSDNPEDAWSFIEGILTEKTLFDVMPPFKSLLAENLESAKNKTYRLRYRSSGVYAPDHPLPELRDDYFYTFFTDQDADYITDLLDNVVGEPIRLAVDPTVTDLINEEISAFLAGARTAEDCAALVQSRVSLWLAEHQ